MIFTSELFENRSFSHSGHSELHRRRLHFCEARARRSDPDHPAKLADREPPLGTMRRPFSSKKVYLVFMGKMLGK